MDGKRHSRQPGRAIVVAIALAAIVLGGSGAASARAAGGISGTVTHAGGSVAEGAGVTVMLSGAGGATQFHSTSTDAHGGYSFDALPSGSYTVGVSPSGVGGATVYYDNASNAAGAKAVAVTDGTTTGGIDTTLPAGGSIAGVVSTASGNPLAGARVSVRAPPASPDYPASDVEIAAATTGPDGTYTVAELPTGSYKVQFSDQGYAPEYYQDATSDASAQQVSVTSGQTTSGIDATMTPANSISGTVTDRSGAPLANIEVTVFEQHPGDGPDWYVATQRSDLDGSYAFGGLLPGTYIVRFTSFLGSQLAYPTQYYNGVAAPDQATAIVLNAGAAATGIDARMLAGATISGRITDTQGNPMPRATVEIVDAPGDDLQPIATGFAARDGTYAVTGLPAGHWYLEFHSGDASRADLLYPGVTAWSDAMAISVTDGSINADVNALLPPSGVVTGQVTPTTSQLTFFVIEGGIAKQTTTIWPWQGIAGYSWTQLAPGTYIARFTAPGYQTQWSGGSATQAQATPFAVIAGTTTTGVSADLKPIGWVPPGTPDSATGANPLAVPPTGRVPATATRLPRLTTHTLVISRDGTAMISLRCMTSSPCAGVAHLKMKAPVAPAHRSAHAAVQKLITVGHAAYRISPQRATRVAIHLDRTGRRMLANQRHRSAWLTLSSAGQRLTTPISLIVAHPRNSH